MQYWIIGLIGASVLLVGIVIVLLVFYLKRSDNSSNNGGSTFEELPNQCIVCNNIQDPSIEHLGMFDTDKECQNACRNTSSCQGYTWVSPRAGMYQNSCFGVTNKNYKITQNPFTSSAWKNA